MATTSGRTGDVDDRDDSVDSSSRPASPKYTFELKHTRSALFAALIGAVLVIQIIRFIHISEVYPFYFMWDMDAFAATEALAINSGTIPRAIFHPGFGMHLIHHLAIMPANWLGVVSAHDVHDLETSLNPVLVLAELTSFLRTIPPILCLGVAVCLWASVALHFRLSPGWCLITLLAFATSPSFIYHATMIRIESYAVFFWSLAVLSIVLAARSRRVIVFWGLIVVAGSMLGLTYLTKVQAIFYVLAFPFVAMFLLHTGPVWSHRIPKFSRRSTLIFPAVTFIGIGVFSVLLLAAMTIPPGEIIIFGEGYSFDLDTRSPLPRTGFGILIAASFLLVFQLICIRLKRLPVEAYTICAVGSCLFIGYVFSTFSHFLMYADPMMSLSYMVFETKLAYMYPPPSYILLETEEYWNIFAANIRFNWVLYSALALAIVALFTATALRRIPIRRAVLAYLVTSAVILVPNLTFGVRFILRDLIWAEVLPTFLTVAVLMLVSQRCTRWGTGVRATSFLILAALSTSNVLSGRLMRDRLDASYNQYGWTRIEWFGNWWTNNAYNDAMRFDNDSVRNTLFASARRHQESKRIGNFVFKNIEPDLRGIGVLDEGLPVWRDRLSAKIVSFPDHLRGGLVFDVSWQRFGDEVFFTRMEKHEEYLQKIVPSPNARMNSRNVPSGWLSILGRPDLRIYILLAQPDRARLTAHNPNVVAQDFKVALADGSVKLEFWGAEIQRYAEINVNEFSSRYFFIVLPDVGDESARTALWP